MNSTPPITDSPWMWLALFSAVGLSALLATGGKFGKRQSGIERRYQARDWQSRDQQARDQQARDQQARDQKARDQKARDQQVRDVASVSKSKNDVSKNLQAGSEQAVKPEYSTPSKTLIGLWPLAGVMGAICGTSLVMLVYTRRQRRS